MATTSIWSILTIFENGHLKWTLKMDIKMEVRIINGYLWGCPFFTQGRNGHQNGSYGQKWTLGSRHRCPSTQGKKRWQSGQRTDAPRRHAPDKPITINKVPVDLTNSTQPPGQPTNTTHPMVSDLSDILYECNGRGKNLSFMVGELFLGWLKTEAREGWLLADPLV